MLDKVIKKAYHDLSVLDLNGNKHDIKVLNFTASGARTSRLDRQCVVDVDSKLETGNQLRLPDGKIIVISVKQADIYKNKVIRYTLDCIEATHMIDVKRSILLKSNQGGLSGQQDTVVYSNIPVKVGLVEVTDSKVIDISLPKYVMFISTEYNLLIGDRITIHDGSFEEAKVNSYVHVTPGLMEIKFDKDPRWA